MRGCGIPKAQGQGSVCQPQLGIPGHAQGQLVEHPAQFPLGRGPIDRVGQVCGSLELVEGCSSRLGELSQGVNTQAAGRRSAGCNHDQECTCNHRAPEQLGAGTDGKGTVGTRRFVHTDAAEAFLAPAKTRNPGARGAGTPGILGQSSRPCDLDLNRPYTLALLLGGLPLLTGTAVFAAWVVTGWVQWIAVGFGVIGLGTLAVLVGLVCLVFAFDAFRSGGQLTSGELAQRMLLALGLQLVNFPAAAGLMLAAIHLESRCVLTLTNATGAELRDWQLTYPGGEILVDTWAAGESRRHSFWPKREGRVELYVGDLNGSSYEFLIDGYVSDDFGIEWTVQLLPEGQIEFTPDE